MDAKVKGIWLIVECPHCHRVQVVNKWVKDNSVINLMKTRYLNCEHCDGAYFVELKEYETEIQ